MGKNHLKCIALPRTWQIPRKKTTFVTRPYPGAHRLSEGMALSTVMTELVKCANTKKEAKSIIHDKSVLLDGKRQTDEKVIVGLMDVVSLKETGENYRVVFTSKGKIKAIQVSESESNIKPCKITGKTMIKGGVTQLNLSDARNIRMEKGKDVYKVGDTVVIETPGQKIKSHFKLERGCAVYLTGGKHIGSIGKLEEIKEDIIKVKTNDGEFETSKEYAFVVGKEKPCIQLTEK